MTEQVKTLEVLEARAERALEKAESGWRAFAEAMREIKESGAHEKAGYRHFATYYRERWEERISVRYRTLRGKLEALASVEEMEAQGGQHFSNLPQPSQEAARVLRYEFPDSEERVKAWEQHVKSGRGVGLNRAGLNQSIAEYKGEKPRELGVIEQRLLAGDVIPPYPEGPTDEELAAKYAGQLSRIAKKVTPQAAAESMSQGMAATTARGNGHLPEWVRTYVWELQLRGGE